MPISPIVLQRRHAELGRIRLGHKVGGNGRPAKLETFRFTSPSESYIRDLAALYGGEPQPWDNNGKPEWEVFTEAKSVPVVAVKNGMSQWMETWSGGGCVHRCDGEVDVNGDACDEDDRAHREAKPTTRLSVMLPELDAIGVWRLESHGWNAAAELPTVAELAAHVAELVPADLHLVERRAIRDGKTSRFVVPVLSLRIGVGRLREVVEAAAQGRELGPTATAPAAIEAGSSSSAEGEGDQTWGEWRQALDNAETKDQMNTIWKALVAEGRLGQQAPATPEALEFIEAFKAKAATVRDEPATTPPEEVDPAAAAPQDGEAEADELWAKIVLEAGRQGMTSADLEQDFAARMGGQSSATAAAAEFRHYLGLLQQTEQTEQTDETGAAR